MLNVLIGIVATACIMMGVKLFKARNKLSRTETDAILAGVSGVIVFTPPLVICHMFAGPDPTVDNVICWFVGVASAMVVFTSMVIVGVNILYIGKE